MGTNWREEHSGNLWMDHRAARGDTVRRRTRRRRYNDSITLHCRHEDAVAVALDIREEGRHSPVNHNLVHDDNVFHRRRSSQIASLLLTLTAALNSAVETVAEHQREVAIEHIVQFLVPTIWKNVLLFA